MHGRHDRHQPTPTCAKETKLSAYGTNQTLMGSNVNNPSERRIDRRHGWGTYSLFVFPTSEGLSNKLVVQRVLFGRI